MPDCNNCKAERRSIPYIVHESDMARLERSIKRLWILLLVTIVLLVGTNAIWIMYESQFEDVVTTIEAEQVTRGGGSNYAVAGDLIGTTEGTGND